MGAGACGCMSSKTKKDGVKTTHQHISNKGGVKLGGNDEEGKSPEDVKAIRAARFEK